MDDFLKSIKWMVITGGVLSGLGKGAANAALGRLLRDGNTIVPIKCDGYLNVDPGTMNPYEHGEVFVLDDGGEVDMDFGHYERFMNINCKKTWNLTSGKIFNQILSKERRGDYLGKTIQVIPHVIDQIKNNFYEIARKERPDIMMIEIGGTVGDIENSWFIEAVRQLKKDLGKQNVLYTHLTYVPYLHNTGEPKTKPAQRDIALLREKGISPDIVIFRSKDPLSDKQKQKLESMCDLDTRSIISGVDVKNVYELPLRFEKQGVLEIISERFGTKTKPDLEKWRALVDRINNPYNTVNLAICGKYTELKDSYASITEALTHAGANLDTRVKLTWVETSDLTEETVSEKLAGIDGVIVPGGFGSRGVEGKIKVIQHARENNIPFLGLCYGLQLAVVEFARNVCRLTDAHTTEIDISTASPVVDILPEQKEITEKGATMRLGSYDAQVLDNSIVQLLYGTGSVSERHRHRYEVNPEYHSVLKESGLVLCGTSSDSRLVEFIEIPGHKYFVATQSHPELKSRLESPAPLFYGLVKACLGCHRKT